MFAERIESKGSYTQHCPALEGRSALLPAADANAEAASASDVPSCPRAELLIVSFIIADESENCYCVNNTIVNGSLFFFSTLCRYNKMFYWIFCSRFSRWQMTYDYLITRLICSIAKRFGILLADWIRTKRKIDKEFEAMALWVGNFDHDRLTMKRHHQSLWY